MGEIPLGSVLWVTDLTNNAHLRYRSYVVFLLINIALYSS